MSLPVTPLFPDQADLTSSSIKSFLRLVKSFGLTVRVQATLVHVEPTYYLSASKEHKIGDLKSEGYLIECVFITATNMIDFAVTTAWHDGKLNNAFVGGQRSGYRPARLFTQITKLNGEIKRCLG